MQVSSIPPIMINLSWVARLSMSLITVFDSPNMLATSSIFLWVPCVETEQQRSRVRFKTQQPETHTHIVLEDKGIT